MFSKLSAGRSYRPAHFPLFGVTLAAAMAVAILPSQAHAQYESPRIEAAVKSAVRSNRELRAFYAARANRPIWIRGDSLGPEADHLLELIETADLDGLDPRDYRPRAVESAIYKARNGSPKALAKAELLLSKTFAAYARDVRRPRDVGMLYVDKELTPTVPSTRAVLDAAAAAPSLERYLDEAGWMSPIYGQLRRALAAHANSADSYISSASYGGGWSADPRAQLIRLNMDRARALPANPGRRYILVDTAAARLFLYEDGRVRDSMKVVVGKSSEQTPMMAGMIRYAMVNPYWNIPPDLAQTSVAPEVLKKGISYLRTKRYEVLSDWSENARVVPPKSVDWKAVAAGRQEIRVRQLPGKGNAMGKMKFMFPNDLGIYLHDTPEKELFAKADRRFSSGCVRVEDAARLAKWLFGKPLVAKSNAPEQRVNLPQPVPVFITYFTAAPQGQTIAFRRDVYDRDGALLQRNGSGALAGR